jgi:glycosyltransferase involved in cell wall biosynthesis
VKILMVIGSLRGGGAERMVAMLANGLKATGMKVQLALLNGRAGDGYAIDPEVEVHELGLRRTNPFSAILRLRRLMSTVHVVYSFLDIGNVLVAIAKTRGGPVLVWGIRAAGVETGWRAHIAFWLARALASRADHCIANSQDALQVYGSVGFSPSNSSVIFNGIDADLFRPDLAARARGRDTIGASQADVVVGVFARVHPVKRHDLIIAAGLSLLERQPNLRFVFAGRGTGAITERFGVPARFAGRFIGLGERPGEDMPALVAALDVGVCASDSEGFPNGVLEAMATGVPCVATRVGSTPDLIGDAGILIDAGDGRGLVDALGRLASDADLRAALGASARQRVIDNFDQHRMITSTAEALGAWAAAHSENTA